MPEPRLHKSFTLAVGPSKSGKSRYLRSEIAHDLAALPQSRCLILTPDDPEDMHPEDIRLKAWWYPRASSVLRDCRADSLPGRLIVVRKQAPEDAELLARAADHLGRVHRRPVLLHYDEARHVCTPQGMRGACLGELAVAYRHRSVGLSVCAQRVVGMLFGDLVTNAERVLLYRLAREADRRAIADSFDCDALAAASRTLENPTTRPIEFRR